ncbi:alpha-N-acetylneuraminate alpha-2,8-sialyltransferase ST8SIA3-like isoform X2 [Petromyzon marinus]|uniref:alpha-N-acetylneuraminate alpha-2,8-sialyltransferase ST8SIA3-like isoform X2 n=1 Tax=Petromyzon marinus TaxID=7757 RepID=UPI003F6E5609
MTRGPCVLGVMVLTAALFALSLVSYVRVRAPGGALRRGGGGGPGGGARRGGLGGAGGGPHRGRASRLYALHSGFRPHMSLGPWETPHARRPRPWQHSPQAVQQLREELSHFVDAVRGFSLTRGDVSEGQLLHFTYSPPRYVYPASQALRSLLPLTPPLQACGRLPSCAVVGSSGLLRGSGCGREIDAHTFVIRCNFAPTGGIRYGPDVGNLTNLTTFNPSILETAYGGLLTEPDRARFRSRLAALGHALLWVPAFLFHTSAHVTRALTDFFLEPGHREIHDGDGEQQGDDADDGHNHTDSDVIRVRLAWPGDIVTNITRFWRTKGVCPHVSACLPSRPRFWRTKGVCPHVSACLPSRPRFWRTKGVCPHVSACLPSRPRFWRTKGVCPHVSACLPSRPRFWRTKGVCPHVSACLPSRPRFWRTKGVCPHVSACLPSRPRFWRTKGVCPHVSACLPSRPRFWRTKGVSPLVSASPRF